MARAARAAAAAAATAAATATATAPTGRNETGGSQDADSRMGSDSSDDGRRQQCPGRAAGGAPRALRRDTGGCCPLRGLVRTTVRALALGRRPRCVVERRPSRAVCAFVFLVVVAFCAFDSSTIPRHSAGSAGGWHVSNSRHLRLNSLTSTGCGVGVSSIPALAGEPICRSAARGQPSSAGSCAKATDATAPTAQHSTPARIARTRHVRGHRAGRSSFFTVSSPICSERRLILRALLTEPGIRERQGIHREGAKDRPRT